MADKPTTASGWKKRATATLTLPSGNVVEVNSKFPAKLLMRTGQFPKDLFEAFVNWQVGLLDDPETASELTDFLVCSTVVKPRITLEPERGAVCIADIDERDLDEILAVASRGMPPATFPAVSDGADAGADGTDVVDAALEPAGA
jgi:ribosomal protein L12E/L44/L45/RPP1/RPP2